MEANLECPYFAQYLIDLYTMTSVKYWTVILLIVMLELGKKETLEITYLLSMQLQMQ